MSLNDAVVIQVVGALVGVFSVVLTRLVDRWLPPMENKHKNGRRVVEEEDVD